ncbi:prohead protease/major capsid protein fusion protein [Methylobacterium sp. A54F]
MTIAIRTAEAGILTRLAPTRTPTASTTWDAETRTFEAVLSSGAAVDRQDARGLFAEVLTIGGGIVLPSRIPLIDSHQRDSVDRQIGAVTELRVIGGELRGRVTLSRHNPQAVRLAAEIGDGAVFGISLGYRVTRWSERIHPETKRRERIAVAWEPLEASLVTIPADPLAGMRGTMEQHSAASATSDNTPADDAGTAAEGNARAAINLQLRSIGRVAGLDQAWIDRQVDAGASVETASTAAIVAMQARSAEASRVRTAAHVLHDPLSPEVRQRAMGEALYARMTPSHAPSDQARPYIGLATHELARECLRAAGVSTTGLSPASVVERALHTTSDFPNLLGDTVGRVLRESYRVVPSAIRPLARRVTAPDFRARHSIGLTGSMKLEKVNEHGEFKSGTMFEAAESYKVDTFGKIFGLTRQAIVNDNLGAFNDVPRMLGVAAANFESDFLASLIASNPSMSDGKPVFHADHGNLAVVAGPINLETLSAARIAMRRQRNEAGDLVGVAPVFLVVAPEQETAAQQAVAEIAAADIANANPFSKLVVIVEARLPAGGWYLSADPAVMPALEYAYLEGEEGPQIVTQAGFDVDGVRFRVRLDFGGGWIDWRGWYRNAGA